MEAQQQDFFSRITAFLGTEEGMIVATTLGIILLSFLVAGVVIFFVMRSLNPAVLRTGTRARAIVRGLEQTSVRINDQWRYALDLEVQPEGEEPFRARAMKVIPVHVIQHAQPGQTVTVRFNPEKRESEIAVEAFGYREVAFANQAELMKVITRQQEDHKRLNEEGLAATGIVVGQEDLGARVNRIGAVVRLQFKVIGADGAPYDAETLTVIHQDRLERYDVGAEVPLRFDPSSPTTIVIDASRAMFSNPGEDPLA